MALPNSVTDKLKQPTIRTIRYWFLLASALILCAPLAHAQTVETSEYLYIGIEAEDYTSKESRWVLTDPGTPTEADDPDGNHSDQAGGNTYLELLPDIRVTHSDPFGPPDAIWDNAGDGPVAQYPVNFPQAGRYYVHVRSYVTGTEDNGIHIGLDDTWPDSGKRLQLCTAGLNAWAWRSSQRDSGGVGSCGVEKTIYLDVVTAGMHTVAISGREDGFEIDRLALIKDLSGNTRVCSPQNIDDVSCVNGSIESADGFIDLRLALEADLTALTVGSTAVVTATLENLDGYDVATSIELTFSMGAGLTVTQTGEHCSIDSQQVTCVIDQLEPTAADEMEAFSFTVRGDSAGEPSITTLVTVAETDENPNNNAPSLSFVVSEQLQYTDVSVSLSSIETTGLIDGTMTAVVSAHNTGAYAANNVQVSLSVPMSFDVITIPSSCTTGTLIECQLGVIDAGESQSLEVLMLAKESGVFVIPASIDADNDGDPTNNGGSLSLLVESASTTGAATSGGSTTGTDGGTSGGGETGGSSTGSTDGTTGTTNGSLGDESDSASLGPLLLFALFSWLALLKRTRPN